MESKKDDAVPSTSGTSQAKSQGTVEDPELDQILEDLVTMENEMHEAAGIDNDPVPTNVCYSPEQLAVLIEIWALKFEKNMPKTPEEDEEENKVLKELITKSNTQKLLGETLNECAKNFKKLLLVVKDCGVCRLLLYTKLCINNCLDLMLSNGFIVIRCPFKDTGISHLALLELKSEVIEIHNQGRCACVHCAKLVPQYDLLLAYLSLHEEIHGSRGDDLYTNN